MEVRPRLKKSQADFIKGEGNRVLVVGDIHAPFCLEGYLDFCKEQYVRFNCNRVVFIGDVIDNHYSSYHETDPDGLGGGDELDLAIGQIKEWSNVFPSASVTIGNHDRLIMRKSKTGGIPSKWVRDYKEVLETPGWDFVERVVIDKVQYVHGEAGKAIKKAMDDMMSTVQGHRHTEMGTEWRVGANFKIFGCAVGCGIDHKSYAMAYAKNFKKPAIGCAVILNGQPINIPMEL